MIGNISATHTNSASGTSITVCKAIQLYLSHLCYINILGKSTPIQMSKASRISTMKSPIPHEDTVTFISGQLEIFIPAPVEHQLHTWSGQYQGFDVCESGAIVSTTKWCSHRWNDCLTKSAAKSRTFVPPKRGHKKWMYCYTDSHNTDFIKTCATF